MSELGESSKEQPIVSHVFRGTRKIPKAARAHHNAVTSARMREVVGGANGHASSDAMEKAQGRKWDTPMDTDAATSARWSGKHPLLGLSKKQRRKLISEQG